ncbi:MAG: ribosome maturation factor RimM [bacterium]
MKPQEVTIGIIIKPHGLRGVLKVRPTTDDPQRYRHLDRVRVYLRGESLGEFQVQHAEIATPNLVLVKFAEHDSCDAVEPLRGAELKIARAECLPTSENQFYHFELIGLSVHTETGKVLGRIVEVIEHPGNDLWVVHDDAQNELLLPAISSVIKEVNLAKQYVIIIPVPGLLDDFPQPRD